MEVGYTKTKDCKGGNRRLQQHDKHYNKVLNKRRNKEKNRRKLAKINRGK